MALIAAKLDKVILVDDRDSQTVFIAERDGPRFFPIEIGVFEALALARRLQSNARMQRPLTHDLLLNAISAMGGQLEAVRIIKLDKGTFFAELVVEASDGEVIIDCRPSDGLVVAAEQEVPLFVDEEIFSHPSFNA